MLHNMKSTPTSGGLPKLLTFILGILYYFSLIGYAHAELQVVDFDADSAGELSEHGYTTRILHTDPLFVHLHNFLSPSEIAHFLNIRYEACKYVDNFN